MLSGSEIFHFEPLSVNDVTFCPAFATALLLELPYFERVEEENYPSQKEPQGSS